MTTSTRMTSTANWTSELKVKQLKQILRHKRIDEERGCVERSDLEDLVRSNVETLEAANKILSTLSTAERQQSKTTNGGGSQEALVKQLRQVLGEDRGVMNYIQYTPSSEHVQRMKDFAKAEPSVFDNPKITPRETWFTNPIFSRSTQMPPYHIHFRREMQEAVRYLYETYAAKTPKSQSRAARNAQHFVQGCLSGLHGHVGIEEHRVFPMMQRRHPKVDLQFLFEDHQRLDREERELTRELNQLVRSTNSSQDSLVPREEIMKVLKKLLAFDKTLMTHLGEEEEVVVPISLASGGTI